MNEAVQQVAFSDKILLNKVDLVTPDELTAIRKDIRKINHFAEVRANTILKDQRAIRWWRGVSVWEGPSSVSTQRTRKKHEEEAGVDGGGGFTLNERPG